MFENLEKRKRRREQPSDRNSTDAEISINSEAPEVEEVKTETPETEDGSSALSAPPPPVSNSTSSTGVNTRRSSQAAVRWRWNCLLSCTKLSCSISDHKIVQVGRSFVGSVVHSELGKDSSEARPGWPVFYPVFSWKPPGMEIAPLPIHDC